MRKLEIRGSSVAADAVEIFNLLFKFTYLNAKTLRSSRVIKYEEFNKKFI